MAKQWATLKAFRAEIADVPVRWLYEFAANDPEDARRMGEKENCHILLRVDAVLSAIENRECGAH